MRLYFFFILLFVPYIIKSQTDSIKPSKKPYLLFEKTTIDMGTLNYGSEAIAEFNFVNTGKAPLIIQRCEPSCGCTVADWPKNPITKKQRGSIKVQYNTTNVGSFSKTITVYSNAQNSPAIITIKGKVKPKETK